MELNKVQKKVDDWIKDHGIRYFDELTNMAQLSEEVGEVARIISRRYGCLLYTSPSPRDRTRSRMPSSA